MACSVNGMQIAAYLLNKVGAANKWECITPTLNNKFRIKHVASVYKPGAKLKVLREEHVGQLMQMMTDCRNT